MIENIVTFVRGGGFVMYPLLLTGLAAVAVIFERLMAFKVYGRIPNGLLGSVIKLARDGDLAQAKSLCEQSSGPLASCLLVVLRNINHPSREVERLVEETGQDYFIRLERLLPILDTITTIAPLLGLLGTIVGMIGAFNAIALHAHQGNSDSVLSGVGAALYATATGLIIAVTCFAAYNYFAARLRTITAETEQGVTKLMNVLHTHRFESIADTKNREVTVGAASGGSNGI